MSPTKTAIKILDVTEDAVRLLYAFTGIGGAATAATLAAAHTALGHLQDGLDGKMEPQVVLLHLESLRDQLASNDAAADAELSKRFPTGGGK